MQVGKAKARSEQRIMLDAVEGKKTTTPTDIASVVSSLQGGWATIFQSPTLPPDWKQKEQEVHAAFTLMATLVSQNKRNTCILMCFYNGSQWDMKTLMPPFFF